MLVIILLCPACTKDMPTVQNMITEQQNEEYQNNDKKPIEIIISHNQNINTPEDIAAHAMQVKLQERLGNQAKVILYADYQMGSAREQVEAMQLDRIHITIQPASVVSSFVEDMKVFTLPYVFSSNVEEVKAVLEGAFEQEALERIGMDANIPDFTGLGLWFGGYKLFTYHGDDNKHIQSPADFQGLSIAVPPASVLKAQYQHWGAETMEVEFIALYSTLAQRIADGSEGSVSQIVSNHIHEVQHNVVQAYHSAEVYVILANTAWFSSLPANMQTAIMEAEQYGKKVLYETLTNKEAAYIDTIRQTKGMRYEVLDEKEQDMFRTSVQSLYKEQLAGSAWQIDYVERLQKCFM